MKKIMLAAMLAAFSVATIAPAFIDQAFAQEEKKEKKGEKKEKKD